jgi:predicted DsbA family dithiol-disulfide isomerase
VVVDWRAFLLDPTTPPEGRPHPYPKEVREQRSGPIHDMAASVGLPMTGRDWISNSRPALEAAEFVKEHAPEHFDAYHHAVFSAYFAEGRDIGDVEVLKEIANGIGIDADAMAQAVADGSYRQRVDEDYQLAQRIGFSGVPAFILGNRAIVGAQPYEVFEEVMEILGREKRAL